MKHLLPIAALLVWVLSACTTQLEPREYVAFFNDPQNGTIASKTLGKLEYSVKYKPAPLIALLQFPNGDARSIDSVVASCKDLIYLDFRIASVQGRPPMEEELASYDEYGSRLQYLYSEIGNHLFLSTPTDTLPCLVHHFERSYGLTPYHTISTVFTKPENTENLKFHYDDQLFGSGPINISLSPLLSQKTPSLKL